MVVGERQPRKQKEREKKKRYVCSMWHDVMWHVTEDAPFTNETRTTTEKPLLPLGSLIDKDLKNNSRFGTITHNFPIYEEMQAATPRDRGFFDVAVRVR